MAKGTTRVTITGSRATVQVGVKNPCDIPGPNGGKLIASQRLWIDVRCAGSPCPHNRCRLQGATGVDGNPQSRHVARGGPSRLLRARLAAAQGDAAEHDYGDNLYQHSTATFGLVWRDSQLTVGCAD